MRERTGPARAIVRLSLAMAMAGAVPASAQDAITLAEAMERARTATHAADALAAGVREAEARVVGARAGYLPRVNATQSAQRGDAPVYVFGALLSQGRFTAANFDIAALNEPPATTNLRTAVTVDQPVFDAGRTRAALRGAALGRELAGLEETRGGQDLALAAAELFVAVLQLESAAQAVDAAVAAARSDLDRARARRDVGLVTSADVLALEVHLADVTQRHMATAGDLAVARMALNEALGFPLDHVLALVRPAAPASSNDAAALTSTALAERPERQEADLRVQLSRTEQRLARAAFLPTVTVQGTWEYNGAGWWNDGRSAWTIGTQLQLNLFNGLADRARLAEARHAETRAAAARDAIVTRIAVDVRSAVARLDTARARHAAGLAAQSQARESQRIVRDRYDAGLAGVTDLLRAAEAVMDADARATAAEMDLVLRAVALDRALGQL